MKIARLTARQILDSRSHPTIEVDVITEGGQLGRASVPSGASTGSHEAVELRDGGQAYGGQGVSQAIAAVQTEIAPALIGQSVMDQSGLDKEMIKLDGTDSKSRLGANAILGVSLAIAKAAALAQDQPLYQYIAELAGNQELSLPQPMINIINGGKHASGSLDIQEIMIVPLGAASINQAIQMGSEIFHALGRNLKDQGYSTLLGDEGGYAPPFKDGVTEALEAVVAAIKSAGYEPGQQVSIALDVAASELVKDGAYHIGGQTQSADELIGWYAQLIKQYPIISIEDGLGEADWAGWQTLTKELGDTLQLVGDDLLVTNPKLLERAIADEAGNAILIKPNQIGTLTETITAVKLAKSAGWRTIVSHRSGETEDTTIAHLAVGLGSGQIKTGSMARGERTAKYNELIRIAESSQLALAKPFLSQP